MGELEISDKLKPILESGVLSEENIVYILSRVRKLLEIDREKSICLEGHQVESRFRVLWFYCNLALHAVIDHKPPDSIYESLIKIQEGSDYSGMWHVDFHKEFKAFLDEKKLSKAIYNKYKTTEFNRITEFNNVLNSIYSNTPIILKKIKYVIRIDKHGGFLFEPYNEICEIIKKI